MGDEPQTLWDQWVEAGGHYGGGWEIVARLADALRETVVWIEDESEGVPSWCGEKAMHEYDRERDAVVARARAALVASGD